MPNRLRLDVLTALATPCTIFELVPQLEYDVRPQLVLRVLGELIDEGVVAIDDNISILGRAYKLVSKEVVEKMLQEPQPTRDPVREAHDDLDVQQKLPRKRRKSPDLDNES